ncbi:MAG: Dabb family protein [Fidelibacterota bacterium]
MIKHIVMWTLKEENKAENAKEMVKRLNQLKDKIDVIVTIEAGENITDSERNYDIALYSEFKSVEDLDAYRVHKAHQEVVTFVRQITDSVVAVDYKF